MGKPGCGGGGGGGGGSGGKPGGGGSGRVGASTEGAATAAAPGATTMGLGQSALVMGAGGISSSEISMSSPEDCWPCGKSRERAVRVSPEAKVAPRVPFQIPASWRRSLCKTNQQRGFSVPRPWGWGKSLNFCKPHFLHLPSGHHSSCFMRLS